MYCWCLEISPIRLYFSLNETLFWSWKKSRKMREINELLHENTKAKVLYPISLTPILLTDFTLMSRQYRIPAVHYFPTEETIYNESNWIASAVRSQLEILYKIVCIVLIAWQRNLCRIQARVPRQDSLKSSHNSDTMSMKLAMGKDKSQK